MVKKSTRTLRDDAFACRKTAKANPMQQQDMAMDMRDMDMGYGVLSPKSQVETEPPVGEDYAHDMLIYTRPRGSERRNCRWRWRWRCLVVGDDTMATQRS